MLIMRFTWILAAALAWAGIALAQAPKSCAEQRQELAAVAPLTAVNRLSQNGCLGGELDANAFTLRVQRLFDTAGRIEGQARRRQIKDVMLSVEEQRALILAVLRAADDYLATLPSAASPADAAEVARMRAEVQAAIRDRGADLAPGEGSPVRPESFWTWDGPETGIAGIDVRAMFARADCGPGPRTAACARTQDAVEGLLRGAQLVRRSYTPLAAEAIQSAAARAAARDARWRSYFADARSQYPWELFVNSWRYESRVRRDRGLSGPPDWQWIVLHPDIAMQYVRDAAAGDRFRPALILELVGYNWWSWGADHRPQNAWGVSLVRTYADTTSVPSSSWGVAVHRSNKYTLTVTRSEGNTGVLLSVDLAGAVTSASQEWKDRFRVGE